MEAQFIMFALRWMAANRILQYRCFFIPKLDPVYAYAKRNEWIYRELAL